MQRAVFLDRDGTINVEAGYLRQLDDLVLMPGAAEAIKQLRSAGYLCVLATNQSGPARGYYGEDHVLALNERLLDLLKGEGTTLDGVYYCPHLPDGTVPGYTRNCDCRKPEPGMLLKAAQDLGIDLGQSYMVGDKATDVEVAHRAGCRGILLRSGYGERVLKGDYQFVPEADFVADDLAHAARWILE